MIRFAGTENEAQFLLPPGGIEDPSDVVQAMLLAKSWRLKPPDSIVTMDSLCFDGDAFFTFSGDDPLQGLDWVREPAVQCYREHLAEILGPAAEESSAWLVWCDPALGSGGGGVAFADACSNVAGKLTFVGLARAQDIFEPPPVRRRSCRATIRVQGHRRPGPAECCREAG